MFRIPRKSIEKRTITIRGHKVLVTSVWGNKAHVEHVRVKVREWARFRFDYTKVLQDLI